MNLKYPSVTSAAQQQQYLNLAQWDGVRRVTIIKSQEPRIIIVLQRVNLFTVYAAKKLAA